MAQKSIIFKAELEIADMNRGYYKSHTISIARHPSETDERMMMRVLAFALYASESLSFANGLSASDEPDLWEKDFTGSISRWIMVGLPHDKAIKKALSRSAQVVILSYGGSAAELWWSSLKSSADKLSNISVINIPALASRALAELVERTMKIQCSIQDDMIWLNTNSQPLEIALIRLKKS